MNLHCNFGNDGVPSFAFNGIYAYSSVWALDWHEVLFHLGFPGNDIFYGFYSHS